MKNKSHFFPKVDTQNKKFVAQALSINLYLEKKFSPLFQ